VLYFDTGKINVHDKIIIGTQKKRENMKIKEIQKSTSMV